MTGTRSYTATRLEDCAGWDCVVVLVTIVVSCGIDGVPDGGVLVVEGGWLVVSVGCDVDGRRVVDGGWLVVGGSEVVDSGLEVAGVEVAGGLD